MSKRDKKKLEARIGIFLRQYGRKAVANWGDPNDRAYDREIERLVKQMDPGELGRLMTGEDKGTPWATSCASYAARFMESRDEDADSPETEAGLDIRRLQDKRQLIR